MPRRNFADGMEITFQDLNNIPAALLREMYDRTILQMLQNKTDGFFGGSLLVTYVSATQVQVAAGLGFQEDNTQVSPEHTIRPIYKSASTNHSITTPDASNPRIDIVCVKASLAQELTGTRKYKDPTDATISDETFTLQNDWGADIQVVAGTAAGSPSAPATPSGYMKIATITVAASTGIAGAGSVEDNRTKLPIGGGILLDTSSLVRLTAGAETSLDTLMADIDGSIGGGGGGGGLQWAAPGGGAAPIADNDNGLDVYKYDTTTGKNQKLVVAVKVPSGYVAGTQINMGISQYSGSNDSSDQLLKTRAYLVRAGTDPISSTTNVHTSTNTVLTSDVVNKLQNTTLDLTDVSGECNGVAVSAGDILRVELFRDTDNDTDPGDVYFIPSSTSVSFT